VLRYNLLGERRNKNVRTRLIKRREKQERNRALAKVRRASEKEQEEKRCAMVHVL